MSHEEISTVQVVPADKAKIWKIWKTALILGFITLIEFAFAFTMDKGVLLTTIFIVLTLVKAGFIVGEFMHLKHEAKALVWSVLLPIMFLCWLILAMKIEGNAIFDALAYFWDRL
ncbi:MAG: cytochrome C oxidase subunit IV family protein [Cyclobacteriaceae bacterium]